MKFNFKYDEKKIIWEIVGQDVYKSLIKKLDPNLEVKSHTNNLRFDKFKPGNWTRYSSSYSRDLIYVVVNRNNEIFGYKCKIYVPHVDSEKSRKSNPALFTVKSKFKELNNTTFRKAFGLSDERFVRCIPKQLYWSQSEPYKGNVSSIDCSSHYPAQLCGILPDSHHALELNGTVKPNEEYPFAFYINSGHMAIYKELDTHNWLFNTKFNKETLFRLKTYRKVFDDTFHDIAYDEDVTVLMKASKYTLEDVMQFFYHNKENYAPETEEYELAKLVLNASIGQMHRKNYCRDKYAHLAAVVIARGNQMMLTQANKIKEDIIQIQVDGILYKGSKEYGIHEKYLGASTQEYTNRPCRWDSTGCYMVDLGNDKFKIKTQGYNAMTDGRVPQESTKFEDMDLWIRELNNEEEEE